SLDTEHIFGFTEGADIGAKGESEFENTAVLRSGKAAAYSTAENESAYRYVIADHFRVSMAGLLEYHSIDTLPGLADRNGFGFDGWQSGLRWRLLDHEKPPRALPLSRGPKGHRIDDFSGARLESYALPAAILADRVLVQDKFFAALNLTYA